MHLSWARNTLQLKEGLEYLKLVLICKRTCTIKFLKQPMQAPIQTFLHSAIKSSPLLQKLCKTLFCCTTFRIGIEQGLVKFLGAFLAIIECCPEFLDQALQCYVIAYLNFIKVNKHFLNFTQSKFQRKFIALLLPSSVNAIK